MNIINNIIRDVRNGQNLDIYITVVVALFVAFLAITGSANPNIVSSAVLAVLALVSVSLLANRRENEGRNPSASSLFSVWSENDFRPVLASAKDISGIYVTSYDLMNAYDEEFKSFLKRGGKLRVLYVKPQSTAATMASQRGYGADAKPEHLQKRLMLSLEKLREISESAPDPSCIQVKFIDFLPATAMTIVNQEHSDGTIFVTVAGFGVNTRSRPSFILRKIPDEKWFGYFKETFDNMWNWEKCEIIDLKNYDLLNQ